MVIIGRRGYDRFADSLRAAGYDPVPLEGLSGLNEIVADHADTLICEVSGRFLLPRGAVENLPERAVRILSGRLRIASVAPRGVYPGDVCLNALTVGKKLFGRLASLSEDVKTLARDAGFDLVNVKQGYAKCAAARLGNAVITADRGLSKAIRAACGGSVDLLVIPAGGIKLEGCEYGFIGGASFVDEKRRRAVFFGSLPENFSREVKDFCAARGYEIIELDGELTDVGGAVILE